ncbi:GMP synthase (glutamine-hydrolyzing) [Vogesella perlucida]|nr:GMP synthase (glutamine-hydrolyzing) [Vogesella perlucida]
MKLKLIIKTGEPGSPVRDHRGRFEDWIVREMGETPGSWQVIWVAAGETLPPVERVAGAVITGSLAMVSDRLPWSEATAAWLRQAHAAQLPLLGICYGHQLLAHALGGEVGYHPQGPEVGSVHIRRHEHAAADPLLGELPPRFAANAFHWQTVLKLPPGAIPLASNDWEPHHAFRLGNSWGLQFHPEFDAEATRQLIHVAAPALERDGLQPQQLAAGVCPTPEAAALLRRFAALLVQPASA